MFASQDSSTSAHHQRMFPRLGPDALLSLEKERQGAGGGREPAWKDADVIVGGMGNTLDALAQREVFVAG